MCSYESGLVYVWGVSLDWANLKVNLPASSFPAAITDLCHRAGHLGFKRVCNSEAWSSQNLHLQIECLWVHCLAHHVFTWKGKHGVGDFVYNVTNLID